MGVLFEQGAALHEPVLGEFVEGVARGGAAVLAARGGQQIVDQGEGVGGVRAAVPRPGGRARARRAVARRHHLFQAGVHGAEERAEPARLGEGQLGAGPVEAVDPGVQGVAAFADHGDGLAPGVRQGRDDGDAERLEALGGTVLAHDRGAFAAGVVQVLLVEMMLEEVGTARGGDAVSVVQQALGDRLAGERLAHARISAQHLADRGNRWTSDI
ncbi:hypothetical protein SBADM41S_04302 [Streptomyces badius]